MAAGSVGAKKGSRPKPPQQLNVPLASAVSSKPQVTKPHFSPEEKIDVKNGDYVNPYSAGARVMKDSLPIKEQNKFSQLILVSGDSLKVLHQVSLALLCVHTLRNTSLFIFGLTPIF